MWVGSVANNIVTVTVFIAHPAATAAAGLAQAHPAQCQRSHRRHWRACAPSLTAATPRSTRREDRCFCPWPAARRPCAPPRCGVALAKLSSFWWCSSAQQPDNLCVLGKTRPDCCCASARRLLGHHDDHGPLHAQQGSSETCKECTDGRLGPRRDRACHAAARACCCCASVAICRMLTAAHIRARSRDNFVNTAEKVQCMPRGGGGAFREGQGQIRWPVRPPHGHNGQVRWCVHNRWRGSARLPWILWPH
jgi:hypothetical protein